MNKKNQGQLTAEDRIELYALLKTKMPISAIASTLGVHRSTLYRECKRNKGKRGYRPLQAQSEAMRRRKIVRFSKWLPSVERYVTEKIRIEWSPEQISATIYNEIGNRMSHESIYKYIYADKDKGGDLYKHLRIASGERRRKRYGKNDYRGKIPGRVDIDKRPAYVEKRIAFGDWEADLVSGAEHKGFLVTLNERKSRVSLIGHVVNKTSALVTAEIIRLLCEAPLDVDSITFDNGREFSGHQKIAKELSCATYFAKPYHSWERGSNENMNGLIRQYFPKKMDLRFVTNAEIEHVMNRLNNRPRKILGYQTPNEVLSWAA